MTKNLIRIKPYHKPIEIIEAEKIEPPELDFLFVSMFQQKAHSIIVDALEKNGIILLEKQIESLYPALYEIGKEYWRQVEAQKI